MASFSNPEVDKLAPSRSAANNPETRPQCPLLSIKRDVNTSQPSMYHVQVILLSIDPEKFEPIQNSLQCDECLFVMQSFNTDGQFRPFLMSMHN